MTAAEPFDCAGCGRRIGKTAGHYLLDDYRVICSRCLTGRRMHAEFFSACPMRCQDMFAQKQLGSATRAGARWVIRRGAPSRLAAQVISLVQLE